MARYLLGRPWKPWKLFQTWRYTPGRDAELEAYLRAFHEPLRRAVRVDRTAALEAYEEAESHEDAIERWRGITTPRAC